MKIGIITFHRSHNCGSMLQAYALQEILRRKYNANVELIDFSNWGQRNIYSIFDKRPQKQAIKNNLRILPHISVVREVMHDYDAFIQENFRLSSKFYKCSRELIGIEKNYDILIAGGDQVWNIMCPDADDAYFLSFAKNVKKVSFSPSLGGMPIKQYAHNIRKYSEYLSDFDFLSVREPNGKKWLEEIVDREIPIVADPTLLLTYNEWNTWLEIPEIEDKFIFWYAFTFANKELCEVMGKISQKLNLPIYVIDGKAWAIQRLDKYGIKRYKISGPIAFLTLVKNAEIVFTQSFHGTLFSTLFEKKFWSYRGQTVKNLNDDRAISIMKQLGVEARFVPFTELLEIDLMQEINYKPVQLKIEKLREEAFCYINGFMNGD